MDNDQILQSLGLPDDFVENISIGANHFASEHFITGQYPSDKDIQDWYNNFVNRKKWDKYVERMING